MGIEHLGSLGHEPHAAKSNDVAVEVARLSRQLQAVSHPIRQFLNLAFLIVVCQQNGAPLLFKVENLLSEGFGGQHAKSPYCNQLHLYRVPLR